jgi:hypothetical protein
MSQTIKAYIEGLTEDDWTPLMSQKGNAITNQETCRTVHCIGNYEQAFALVLQRSRIKGQSQLDLNDDNPTEEILSGEYIYRAIATNQNDWSDSDIVHCYNQRAEDNENRIKELKLDFGGDTLPCSDFNANAFYFLLTTLSYNLFALMRQLLPEELSRHRAMTIR